MIELLCNFINVFLADCTCVFISLHNRLVYSAAPVILIVFEKGTSKDRDFYPLSPRNMGIVFDEVFPFFLCMYFCIGIHLIEINCSCIIK